jgi:hypothetical protein
MDRRAGDGAPPAERAGVPVFRISGKRTHDARRSRGVPSLHDMSGDHRELHLDSCREWGEPTRERRELLAAIAAMDLFQDRAADGAQARALLAAAAGLPGIIDRRRRH